MTINESGNIISAQDYYPYGEILRSYTTGGNVNDKYKYIGRFRRIYQILRTEKERDTESGWDYFGARYYDSELSRWLQVDPFADKYPGWSPYNYCINNPLGLVDQRGMAPIVDDSQLSVKDKQKFEETINTLKESKRFASEWKKLEDSKSVYIITSDKTSTTHFQPNSSKKGTGGTLNIVDFDLGTTVHEAFHAFQNNEMDVTRSTGLEVEAYLFTASIGFELGFPTISGAGESPQFDKYYNSLMDIFSDEAWRGAINTFKESGFNIGNRYKDYNTNYYNPTIIKRLYPLW